jgi:predicted TIM-barrel fold metal-dependent hydrolase
VIRRGGGLALLIPTIALGLSLLGVPAHGQNDLPIFDTHLHYSRDGWDAYPVPVVLGFLDRGGIRRAFVSSSPDEGTVMLYEAAPDRIVPVLRPYRERGELGSWYRDASVPPYLESRLRRPIYKGIGEFHLSGTDAGSPVVRQVVELARRHKLFLHCHCDAEAIEILAGLASDLAVLWAHAGMSSGPDVVGPLVARHPRLVVELALRSDVAPGGRLDPAWRALFTRHPDRFMVGTDTWVASRWPQVPDVQDAARTWLRQLPADVARRIASENAERLAAGPP